VSEILAFAGVEDVGNREVGVSRMGRGLLMVTLKSTRTGR